MKNKFGISALVVSLIPVACLLFFMFGNNIFNFYQSFGLPQIYFTRIIISMQYLMFLPWIVSIILSIIAFVKKEEKDYPIIALVLTLLPGLIYTFLFVIFSQG